VPLSGLDTRGGNAVNIAYCLAKLGVHVKLFTIANEIGEAVLRKIFLRNRMITPSIISCPWHHALVIAWHLLSSSQIFP
jgi:hypothetical protein